jgi:hypothetical protein
MKSVNVISKKIYVKVKVLYIRMTEKWWKDSSNKIIWKVNLLKYVSLIKRKFNKYFYKLNPNRNFMLILIKKLKKI